MHSLSTQVLIVGAGPAGLATAIGLAQRGVDFVIVDALDEAQNTSRAAVIHAATLDSLRALSLSDRLVAQGIEVPQFRIRERDAVLFDASFAGLPTPTPFALMIPQDETERIFIDRLAELGHVVRRPVRLTSARRCLCSSRRRARWWWRRCRASAIGWWRNWPMLPRLRRWRTCSV